MKKTRIHIQYAKEINSKHDLAYAELYMLTSDIVKNKVKLDQIL